MFTIDNELDLPGSVAGSISSCADKLSSLVSRGGGDEEAAVRIQGEGRTTQVHQLPTLQTNHQRERSWPVRILKSALFTLIAPVGVSQRVV